MNIFYQRTFHKARLLLLSYNVQNGALLQRMSVLHVLYFLGGNYCLPLSRFGIPQSADCIALATDHMSVKSVRGGMCVCGQDLLTASLVPSGGWLGMLYQNTYKHKM